MTFVISLDGDLLLAPRRSEHVACASGRDVLAAGEIRFVRRDGSFAVAEVTNQSTGYCPDVDSFEAVRRALASAEIPGPATWSHAFVFRRCPSCSELNIVKESWFVCAFCDAELPKSWNVGSRHAAASSEPDVSRFEHLWDGSEPGWVLFGSGSPGVINVLTSMAVLIEDPDEHTAVINEMRRHGARLVRDRAELDEVRVQLATRR